MVRLIQPASLTRLHATRGGRTHAYTAREMRERAASEKGMSPKGMSSGMGMFLHVHHVVLAAS